MAILRVTITGIYLNQRCQNVIHFRKGDFVSSEANVLAAEVRDVFVDQIRFQQNVGYQYQTIVVQKKDPPADLPVVLDISDRLGTNTGAGAVTVIALLFTLRTSDPTHKGRGRIYIGGVHGQTPLNGLVHPGVVNNMTTIAGIWLNQWGPAGSSLFDLVVGPHSYSDPTAFKQVQAILARSYFGVQRRRNIGVGG